MIQDSTYTVVKDILEKLGGDVTIHYDSTYSICLAILEKLGGDITKKYDSIYSIVEAILPLAGEGGKCNLDVLKVIANGNYNPGEGFDGFSSVEVAVPLPVIEDNKTQKIVQNGDTIIIPTEGNDAMKQATVTIEVPTGEAIDVRKAVTINKNGVTNINPDPGFGGIEGADVTVEVTPDLEPLNETITENGTKSFVSTKDGYSSVDITTNVQPKLQDKTEDITNNGTFNIVPDLDFDGMKKTTVNVNVPEQKPEEIGNETIISNGKVKFTPAEGSVFSEMNVDVQVPIPTFETEELTATENKVYTPTKDGYSKVTVDVPLPALEERTTKEITRNGNYTVGPTINPETSRPYDGMKLCDINVNIPLKKVEGRKSITINSNRVENINPSEGFDGIEGADITVNVQPKLQSKTETINNNGNFDVFPDLNYDGLNKVTVDVNVPEQKPEEKGNETITANGLHQYTPTPGHVFNAFDVNVEIPLEENKEQAITSNGPVVITPSVGNTAMKQATINVNVPGLSVEEEQTINQRLDTIIG